MAPDAWNSYSTYYVSTASASNGSYWGYYPWYSISSSPVKEKADAKQIAEGWDPDANP